MLALAQRRLAPVVYAVVSVAVAALFLVAYPGIGPSTSYTPQELEFLRANAEREPGESSDPFATDESSTESHWRNLRDGIRTVRDHPQGYGLGNAGVVAKRTGVEIKAGESTYTELGVDAGVAGLAAFLLWNVMLLLGLWRREPWVAAAFSRRSPARPADGRDRRALARGRRLGARRGSRSAVRLRDRLSRTSSSPLRTCHHR